MSLNLRKIPKIDELLEDERIKKYEGIVFSKRITKILRVTTEYFRKQLMNNKIEEDINKEELHEKIIIRSIKMIEDLINEKLQKVINATGIVIHTNLGRSPMSIDICNETLSTISTYNNLEYSTVEGKRRSRLQYIEQILIDLTGCESAIVVNNNAAAVFLCLNSLCKNKEALLSRGEIVEIGDSFRISDIMEQSGTIIKEIGTTNKTKIDDYKNNINENTGLLLKIHTSNYKIVGFTEEVSSLELSKLSKNFDIPLMEDMGSGILTDLRKIGFKYQRQVKDAINEDVDIVTFSGDKMLGGPQAGIIAGKKKYIDIIRKNQLLRCLRVDKMCLAALENTLMQYYKKDFYKNIIIFKYLTKTKEELKKQSYILKEELLKNNKDLVIEIKEHFGEFGGGSIPNENIEGFALFIKSKKFSTNYIENYLRNQKIPIITIKQNDEIIINLRTIEEEDKKFIINYFKDLT